MNTSRMKRKPLLLEDFSNVRTSAEGAGRRWGARGEKTYASVEIVNAEDYPEISRGKKQMLKFNYDFRYETTEGGSRRAYFNTWAGENLHPASENIKDDPFALVIPEGEYPTHLAMWVYGDGNDAWFNGMLVDAEGRDIEVTCGDQDWIGWKFVLMDIPPNLSLPFYVAYPARLLTGNQTIHGSLFIDGIFAVYGGIDFDVLPPVITELSCERNTGKSGLPLLSALISDPDDEENNCTASGVDPERTQIFIDGVRHTKNLGFADSGKDLRIEFVPDFPLCGGFHCLEIKAFDKTGNRGDVREFFEAEGELPRCDLNIPDTVNFGGGLECRFDFKGAKKNTLVTAEFKVDEKLFRPGKNFISTPDGISAQAEFEEGLVRLKIDSGEKEGDYEAAVLTLSALELQDKPHDTLIMCEKACLKVDGTERAFCFKDAGVSVLPGLELKTERLCPGFDTIFTVTDSKGQPVAGARVYESLSDTLYPGETDKDGRLMVDSACAGGVGEKKDFYAGASGEYSLVTRYFVSNDLGSNFAENLNVTCGVNCNEMYITWQTGVAVTNGAVRYALKSPEKTELADDDECRQAVWHNHFCTLKGEPGEMNGFKVRLDGLKAGADYLYRVQVGETWGETREFNTLPDSGEIVFGVLADTHNVCGGAMNAALKFAPDLSFFAHAGDFVSAGGVYDDWQTYFADGTGLHAQIPAVTVAGNHDLSDGTGASYLITHATPANGPDAAPEGLNYYTELNDILFISLGGGFEDDSAMMAWIDDVLKNSSMKWRIVLVHEGPYTCYINSASEEIKWGDYFNTAGIDMLLSGHDHTFHRATIKDRETVDAGEVISSSQGVTYIQCATSGGPSRHDWPQHRPIWNAVFDSLTPSVSIFRVKDDRILANSICLADNEQGYTEFDRFELRK